MDPCAEASESAWGLLDNNQVEDDMQQNKDQPEFGHVLVDLMLIILLIYFGRDIFEGICCFVRFLRRKFGFGDVIFVDEQQRRQYVEDNIEMLFNRFLGTLTEEEEVLFLSELLLGPDSDDLIYNYFMRRANEFEQDQARFQNEENEENEEDFDWDHDNS